MSCFTCFHTDSVTRLKANVLGEPASRVHQHLNYVSQSKQHGPAARVLRAQTSVTRGGLRITIRYRPKGVFGKGVGNSQKCIRNASEIYWEKRNVPKCVKIAPEMRQKCAEHLWGGDTFWTIPNYKQENFGLIFLFPTHARDPPVLKLLRRVNAVRGVKSLWR